MSTTKAQAEIARGKASRRAFMPGTAAKIRASASATHTCCVPGCGTLISGSLIMCRADWILVPSPIQKQLWQLLREHRAGSATALRDYAKLKQQAIAAVLGRKGAQ